MFERFTRAARDVVVGAQEESRAVCAGHVGTEHLLLALLAPGAGPSHEVLAEAGLSADQVRAAVVALAGRREEVLGPQDAAALRQVGIDLDQVLRRIEASFGADALRSAVPPRRRGLLRRRPSTHLPFTPGAKKTLELALREAIALGHREIGSAHLLLGLLREGGSGARVLADAGVDPGVLRAATLRRSPRAA